MQMGDEAALQERIGVLEEEAETMRLQAERHKDDFSQLEVQARASAGQVIADPLCFFLVAVCVVWPM